MISPCLLDGLPYCQEPEPNREAGSQSSKLEVLDGSRHCVVQVAPRLGKEKLVRKILM